MPYLELDDVDRNKTTNYTTAAWPTPMVMVAVANDDDDDDDGGGDDNDDQRY